MHESEKWKWSHSVMSNPQRFHGLQPTRLLRPKDFPGKSTGVGCHCLLLRTRLNINIMCKVILINTIGQIKVFGISCPNCEDGFTRWVPRDLLGSLGAWVQWASENSSFPSLWLLSTLLGDPKWVKQMLLFSYDGIKFGNCQVISDMWCGKNHAKGVGDKQTF